MTESNDIERSKTEEGSRRTEEGNRRIRYMKQQRDSLNARILNETVRVRNAEHRKDERRKILTGAWAYEQVAKDSDFSRLVMAGLERFLVRGNDRALFGLPPIEAAVKK